MENFKNKLKELNELDMLTGMIYLLTELLNSGIIEIKINSAYMDIIEERANEIIQDMENTANSL